MRKILFLAAVLPSLALDPAANAAITASLTSGFNFGTFDNNTPGDTSGNSSTLWGPITFSTAGGSPQGAVEDTSLPGYYGQPGGDDTNYLFAAGGGTATVTWDHDLTSFDIYWGSVDLFNTLTLSNGDSITGTGLGAALGFPPDRGEDLWIHIFDPTPFNAFTASSSQPAFEFDLPTRTVATIPEPSTWGLMLLGFAGLCATAVKRRAATADAAQDRNLATP